MLKDMLDINIVIYVLKLRPLELLEIFIPRVEVLEYGSKTAAHYSEIRASLERKGITIGVNDLHIAGHARCEGLTLLWLDT